MILPPGGAITAKIEWLHIGCHGNGDLMFAAGGEPGLSFDRLRLQIPWLVDDGQHEDILFLALVEDAVGIQRRLPDGLVIAPRHYSSDGRDYGR